MSHNHYYESISKSLSNNRLVLKCLLVLSVINLTLLDQNADVPLVLFGQYYTPGSGGQSHTDVTSKWVHMFHKAGSRQNNFWGYPEFLSTSQCFDMMDVCEPCAAAVTM